MGKGISNFLRRKILKRDNYECRKCGEHDESGNKLQVHHIIPSYKSKNDNPDNLITLCLICHKYAPDSKEEFEEYLSDQISGFFTTMVKVFNRVRSKYPKEEWEKVNQEVEPDKNFQSKTKR